MLILKAPSAIPSLAFSYSFGDLIKLNFVPTQSEFDLLCAIVADSDLERITFSRRPKWHIECCESVTEDGNGFREATLCDSKHNVVCFNTEIW